MPFDILNYLLNEFNQVDAKLTDKNNGPVDQKEYEAFNKLHKSLIDAERFVKILSAGNQALTKLEATIAAKSIDDFVKEFDAYSKESSAFTAQPARDLCKNVEYTLFAVKTQAGYLEKASKPEENAPMPTMNDIMSDYSWVKDVFKTDPDAAEYRKEPETKWKASEHSIDENLRKYKECLQELPTRFINHVINVTGDTSDPMKTFGDKVKLVQLAMEHASGNKETAQKFGLVDSLYTSILKGLDLNEISSMDSGSLVNDHFFDSKIVYHGFKDDVMSGDIGKLEISEENKKVFLDAARKLKTSTYNMGIDSGTLQTLNETTKILNEINIAVDYLVYNNGHVNAYDNGDTDSPIYNALKTANGINQKVINFLKGTEDAQPIGMKDIEDLINALADSSLKSNPVNEDGSVNFNYECGLNSVGQILKILSGEKYSSFTELYDSYKQQHKDRKTQYTKEIFDNLKTLDDGSEEYDNELTKYKELEDRRYLDEDISGKINLYLIFRDVNYRDSVKESGTLEQRILCSVIDYEYNCACEFAGSDKTIRSWVKYPFDRSLAKSFTGGYTFDEKDMEEIEAYRNKVLNSKAIKELISRIPDEPDEEALKELVNDGNCGKLYYNNNSLVLNQLNSADIDALTQSSGNLYAANSEEYKAVGSAMMKYADETHKPEGVSAATCKALYEACTTYMYTHDSNPATTNGKRRFNAAASVMAKLLPELLEKNPEMKAQVDEDVKVNMIRSKVFRNEFAVSGNSAYQTMAINIATLLESEYHHDMVTGKMPTKQLRDSLLAKYDSLEKNFEKKTAEKSLSESGKVNKDNKRVQVRSPQ